MSYGYEMRLLELVKSLPKFSVEDDSSNWTRDSYCGDVGLHIQGGDDREARAHQLALILLEIDFVLHDNHEDYSLGHTAIEAKR